MPIAESEEEAVELAMSLAMTMATMAEEAGQAMETEATTEDNYIDR